MTTEHLNYCKKLKRRKLAIRLTQIGILFLFFGIWELVAALEWIDPFIISSPSRMASTLAGLIRDGMFFPHVAATLWETVVSFLLATAIGTAVAIVLWWSDTLRKVTEPYVVVLNALPKIALGPLIIIWVGAGRAAIITMALLISVIITTIGMLSGFNEVDKEKIQLLRAMRASKLQILTKLVLPANIPTLMSTLKINVGLSWVGTIMGEYLVSREGIGYLLVYGSQIFKLDLVMTMTLVLCLLATAMYLIVALFEKLIARRY